MEEVPYLQAPYETGPLGEAPWGGNWLPGGDKLPIPICLGLPVCQEDQNQGPIKMAGLEKPCFLYLLGSLL